MRQVPSFLGTLKQGLRRPLVLVVVAAIALGGSISGVVYVTTADEEAVDPGPSVSPVPLQADEVDESVQVGVPSPDESEEREVFFLREDAALFDDPGSYEAVPVRVDPSGGLRSLIRETFSRLLEGPTPEQEERGLRSPFSDETADTLDAVSVESGHVVVNFTDFTATLDRANTSGGSAFLLVPMYLTVFQFEDVVSVEFRVGGSCEAFFGRMGGSCVTFDRADYEAWIARTS